MFNFLNTTAWWSWNSLPGHSVAVIHLSVAGPFVPRGPFQAAHHSWQVWAVVCCEPIINPFICHCNIPESLENQARKRPIQAHIARGLAPRTLGVLVCGCGQSDDLLDVRPAWKEPENTCSSCQLWRFVSSFLFRRFADPKRPLVLRTNFP